MSRGGTGSWERVTHQHWHLKAVLGSSVLPLPCAGQVPAERVGLATLQGPGCSCPPQAELAGRAQALWSWLDRPLEGGMMTRRPRWSFVTLWAQGCRQHRSGSSGLKLPFSGPSVRPSHLASLALTSKGPALVFILASPQTQALSLQAITAITSHLPPLCSLLLPLLAASSLSSVPPSAPLTDIWSRVSQLEGGAENFHGQRKSLPTPHPQVTGRASELGLVQTLCC